VRRFLAAAALLALILPSTAAAKVHVRGVDTSGYPEVRLTVVTPKPTRIPPTVTENGLPATGVRAENLGVAKSVVLAVDRSQSMKGKPLTHAIAAAREFVASKPAADRILVGAFATEALLLTGFSSATIDADSALSSLTVDPAQGTKLYDELVAAARAISTEQYEGRVIIVVTDGNETRSKASLEQVIAAAHKAHAAIYVIAIESSKFTPAPLKKLASQTGGRYFGTGSAAGLKEIYASIAKELKRTWKLEFLTSGAPGAERELQVEVAGQGRARVPITLPANGGGKPHTFLPDFVFKPAGTLLLALVVALFALLALAALTEGRGTDFLRRRIQSHVAIEAKAAEKSNRQNIELLAGLFQATERAFAHTRQWRKAQRLLERADVPLRTVEFIYIVVGSGVLVGFLFALTGQNGLVVLAATALGALLPVWYLSMKAKRRLNAFEAQLPDMLLSIAASLKAGHSFKQAMQAIVDEGYEPAGKELKRVLTETQLGRPMEHALADSAERVGSKNYSFIVTAVTVQMQVGGSLASIFDMVADTVRSRQQFAKKVRALTAMGRASSYVLLAVPFGLAAVLTAINADYMSSLYNTSTGHMLMGIGLASMTIGALILRKIVAFKG
jgi:tight adherence protein B